VIAAIPNRRRVRVVGRLDLIGVSQHVLKLEILTGIFVTAVWQGEAAVDVFKDLLNHDVVVEGFGTFRPSGILRRIDADALVVASAADEFFRQVPTAAVVRDYQEIARLRPGEKSVYAKILGSIPAEESDEEFEAAVAALR
jgi:hypothetical protein